MSSKDIKCDETESGPPASEAAEAMSVSRAQFLKALACTAPFLPAIGLRARCEVFTASYRRATSAAVGLDTLVGLAESDKQTREALRL